MSKNVNVFDHESFAKEFKDLATRYNLKIRTADLISTVHKDIPLYLTFSSDMYVLSRKKKSYHEY